MANLKKDIEYADTICNGLNDERFGFVYSRTNENLIRLFDTVNVLDKDVYTVLSSADIFFSAYGEGAKRVDCFDINPITYRYLHLRKWLLKFKAIDADGYSKSELLWIINHIQHFTSLDEQESTLFWKDYINKIKNVHFYSNILFEYIEKPDVPYKQKIEMILKLLEVVEPKFDNIDICSPLRIDVPNKYDRIFLSSILDYNREPEKLQIAYDNLLKILKDSGSIICTHYSQYKELSMEKDMFSQDFDYEELFVDENGSQDILYYKYTKK